jgi:AraC family transcriptional regulator
VTKPEFTVVGMRYHGKNESGEIPALWVQFGPRMDEIQHRRLRWEAYGVCFTPDDQGRFEYIAGVDVEQAANVPAGMVARSVPASQYAVFTCTLPTIHEAYDYAFHTWLPKSGHEWGGTPDFELYDETFEGDIPESKMYIYTSGRQGHWLADLGPDLSCAGGRPFQQNAPQALSVRQRRIDADVHPQLERPTERLGGLLRINGGVPHQPVSLVGAQDVAPLLEPRGPVKARRDQVNVRARLQAAGVERFHPVCVLGHETPDHGLSVAWILFYRLSPWCTWALTRGCDRRA